MRYFTPGPTELHPLVAEEIAAAVREGFPSESHRSTLFRAEVAGADEALRTLLRIPADHRVLFTASATEAMERVAEGTVRKRSFHLVNGAFARRFRRISANLGRKAGSLEVPDGEGFRGNADLPDAGIVRSDAEPSQAGILRGDPETSAPFDLLCLTQNETSTGARIPPDAVHALADRAHAEGALVAVDLVSGWPTEPVDPGRIDAGLFSVQKGFGLPAGLGVIVASPELVARARRLQAEGRSIGGYAHLVAMADAADRHQTVVTPNMLGIRLLRRVTEDYLDRGIEALRAEAEAKARRVWESVERIDALAPFVKDEETRSRTILVLEEGDADSGAAAGRAEAAGSPEGSGAAPGDAGRLDALRTALRGDGFLIGDGYGPWKGRHLRIANFPVHAPDMMEALLERIAALSENTDSGTIR